MPITSDQVREYATFLDTETLQVIIHPQFFSPWHSKVMLSHDRLGHLPFVEMFKLVHCGRLPNKFLELKGKALVYPSCVFAKTKCRAWRSRGDHGSIRKLTQVNPGDNISIY